MKHFLKFFFVTIYLLFSSLLFGQQGSYSSIYVDNPGVNIGWQGKPGTLESAEFSLRPQGVYMEVGMYLTFSARETLYEFSGDSLEIEMDFTLPEGSMVTDSWLWIEDNIIQAAIEERWQAVRTYREIVGGRTDPSILTKNSDFFSRNSNNYNLRIFPLESDSTRRVKINYLTPMQWSKDKISIPIPVHIVNSSSIPPDEISISYFPEEGFSNPGFQELPFSRFTESIHASLGQFYTTTIGNDELPSNLNFELDVKMNNGVYVSSYNEEGKQYYQIAMIPTEVFDIEKESKHIMIVADYDTTYTSLTENQVIQILKSELSSHLTESDFFNIAMPFAESELISESWIKASPQNIENVFDLLEIGPDRFTANANFTELVLLGIDQVVKEGVPSDIILLSSNEDYFDETKAESFFDHLKSKIGSAPISIHTLHYQDKVVDRLYDLNPDGSYDQILGSDYPNQDLYLHLAQSTGGTLHYSRDVGTLSQLLFKAISNLTKLVRAPTIKTSTEDGDNCLEEYYLDDINPTILANPVVMVGKCRSDNTMLLLEAETSEGIQSVMYNVNDKDVYTGNEVTKISYFGNYIHHLEETFSGEWWASRQLVEEVIEFSIRFRVLSYFTAFLALEESLGGFVCEYCVDETDISDDVPDNNGGSYNNSENERELDNISFGEGRGGVLEPYDSGEEFTTSTEEVSLKDELTITAYPNPFQSKVEIKISASNDLNYNDFKILLYDLTGSVVKEYSQDDIDIVGGEIVINWDGYFANGSFGLDGVYFLTIQSKTQIKTIKLVKVD